MPLKREARADARPRAATLENVAEVLAQLVDDATTARDRQRLAAAHKLTPLDALYLAALGRRETGELAPREPRAAAPLRGAQLMTLEETTEALVRLMSDEEADRERRRLKAAKELSQGDRLYLAVLRERRARTKNRRKDTP